jgi:type II secretory pathway component GspD/PulD (secretin)
MMTKTKRTVCLLVCGSLLTLALTAQTRPSQLSLGAATIQVETQPAGGQTSPSLQSQAPAIQLDRVNPDTRATPYRLDNLENVSLRVLLSAIAQEAGLNLVMPDVPETTVSISAVEDASLEDVLNLLVIENNLRYEIDGKILRVFKPRMVDAWLEFVYINGVRSQSTSLGASASAGVSGGGVGGLGGGGVSGGSSSTISSNETTDLPTRIEAMINSFKSGPGASIQHERMLGQFHVRDYPENIARMREFLAHMKSRAGIQVFIEANLVEVQLNKTSQAGVNWRTLLGNTVNFSSSLAQDSAFSASLSFKGFDLLLSGLETYGKVNVLSKPHVSTLNGQPALVRIGTQDVFFVTQTQSDPRTGQILQTAETPATVNEGVVLDVTPTVQSDGAVFLRLHPTITERTGAATSQRGNSVPILDVREADTTVIVPNGGTIVIAGLISDKTLGNSTKTPLSKIPVIGGLFSRKSEENRKTDLVVMLTPHVFDLNNVAEMTRMRQDNIDAMKSELEKRDGKKK